jgi:hypothetical protein
MSNDGASIAIYMGIEMSRKMASKLLETDGSGSQADELDRHVEPI